MRRNAYRSWVLDNSEFPEHELTEHGKFTDTLGEVARLLNAELRRLSKAGLADLALRPHRYPGLTEKFVAGYAVPTDTVSRLAYNERRSGAVTDFQVDRRF